MGKSDPPSDQDANTQREGARQRRRTWDAVNRDRVLEHRRGYRETHRTELAARQAERERKKSEAARSETARREREREYSRTYRKQNADQVRDTHRSAQRAWIAKQLTENPEGFRDKRNGAGRAYREKNRERYNLQAREYAREKAGARSEQQAAYRAAHRDEIARKRREAYAADPKKVLAYNRRYKARERRRIEIGLPTKRIHRSTTAERKANEAAADAFFSGAEVAGGPRAVWKRRLAWAQEQPTAAEVIAAMERQHERLRAENGQPLPPPHAMRKAEREEVQRVAKLANEHEERMREQRRISTERAEEARMDSIAAEINARLRRHSAPRPRHPADPAAPFTVPGQPSTGGLSR